MEKRYQRDKALEEQARKARQARAHQQFQHKHIYDVNNTANNYMLIYSLYLHKVRS